MELILTDITKSYHGMVVLDRVTMALRSGETYCLMGASGIGKTTLLRILLGLERPDGGTLTGNQGKRIVAVFQEDRLCEAFTPVDNVMLAAGRGVSRQEAKEALGRLLPRESLDWKVSSFSGGMKRRVALCRALFAPSDAILMDEPFTGLDEDTKKQAIHFIKEQTLGKLLVATTHQEEDLGLLGGTLITLRQTHI